MPIPGFDGLGLLPAGVWECNLEEVAERFCWNDHRAGLWAKCRSFIDGELVPHGLAQNLLVDGSFVRAKELPSDVDLVVDCSSVPAEALGRAVELRLKHDEIKAQNSVDLWLRHPLIPHDLGSFFQYAGDKCAVELSIQPRHPKGILRVRL